MSEIEERAEMVAQLESIREELRMLVSAAQGDYDPADLPAMRALGLQSDCERDDEEDATRTGSSDTDHDGDCIYDHDHDVQEWAQEYLADYGLSIEGVWKGSSKDEAEYHGCILVITTGGPHIQLDTSRRVLEGWGWFGSGKAQLTVDRDVCDYWDEMVDQG